MSGEMNDETPPKSPKPTSISGWRWYLREVIAILLWSFTVLIVTGVCPFANTFPQRIADIATWNHIVALALFLLGFVWLIGIRALWHVAYVTAYPLVLALRFLPKLLVKHWPLFLIFLPGIRNFLQSLTAKTGMLLIAGGALMGAFSFQHPGLRIACWVILVAHLGFSFFHHFRSVYRPATAYSELLELLEKVGAVFPTPSELAKKLHESQHKAAADGNDNKNPLDLRSFNLLVLYGVGTALHYIASRMESIHKTSRIDYYVWYLYVKLFVQFVIVFTSIFLSMYYQDHAHFNPETGLSWLDFLLFSFSNVFSSDTSGIIAVSRISRGFATLEQVFLWGLGGLLASTLFTTLRERHRSDLAALVKRFRDGSDAVADTFEKDFALSVRSVEEVLISFAPAIAKWLISVRSGSQYADVLMRESSNAKIGAIDVEIVGSTMAPSSPATTGTKGSATPKKGDRKRKK